MTDWAGMEPDYHALGNNRRPPGRRMRKADVERECACCGRPFVVHRFSLVRTCSRECGRENDARRRRAAPPAAEHERSRFYSRQRRAVRRMARTRAAEILSRGFATFQLEEWLEMIPRAGIPHYRATGGWKDRLQARGLPPGGGAG